MWDVTLKSGLYGIWSLFKGEGEYGSVLWVWNLNIHVGLLLLLGLAMSHVECYFEIRYLAVFLFKEEGGSCPIFLSVHLLSFSKT